MDEKRLTAKEVEAWLAAVRDDLHRLDSQLGPLLEEQQRLQSRELLLKNLLDSFGNRREPGDTSARVATLSSSSSANGSHTVADYVIERAIEILREEGKPLHINDLHAGFLRRGFAVPGAGKSANLIVHLRRSSEIASPRRGIYGLVEHVGELPKRTPRKKRKSTTRSRPRRGKR
jgi:hypothetical protein